MLTINQATILGRLGKDPEVRSTKSGMTVATFSVATDYASGKGESRETVTEWHNVVCFDKTAEYIAEALHKGDPVFVQGRIQTRKWQDKNGNDRLTTEIIASVATSPVAKADSKRGTSRPAQSNTTKNYGSAASSQPAEDEDLPF